MKTAIDFENTLKRLRESEGAAFYADETALFAEHAAAQMTEQSNFAVKMLSVVGGLFATIAFVGFLFAGGLFKSEFGLLLTGLLFVVAALAVHKTFDTLLIDTACISFFIIGFVLLGMGFDGFNLSNTLIYLSFIAIGIVTILIARHYLLTFLSVIVIAVSALAILVQKDTYSAVHLFNFCTTLLLTYLMLHEAKIMAQSQKMAELFAPTRTALLLVLLTSLLWAQNMNIFHYNQTTNLNFLSTLPCAIGILYLISKILVILEKNTVLSQIIVYSIALALLSLTALSPLISGALLVLLLCFYTNYKTGGAVAIAALIYALSQYYYDLNLTLLQKSGILLGSGLLFLLFYFLTQRTFANDEKL